MFPVVEGAKSKYCNSSYLTIFILNIFKFLICKQMAYLCCIALLLFDPECFASLTGVLISCGNWFTQTQTLFFSNKIE